MIEFEPFSPTFRILFGVAIAAIYIAFLALGRYQQYERVADIRYMLVSILFWIAAIIFLYVVSSGIYFFLYSHPEQLLERISKPSFLFHACLMAIFLFWMRGRWPVLYGTIEIIVSVVAIRLAISSSSTDILTKMIGILGGMYIFVRGMDNVEKGLPERLKGAWKAVFLKGK